MLPRTTGILRGGEVVVFPQSCGGGGGCRGIPMSGVRGSRYSRGPGGLALPVGTPRPRPPALAAPFVSVEIRSFVGDPDGNSSLLEGGAFDIEAFFHP